jgi:hypothetical protein
MVERTLSRGLAERSILEERLPRTIGTDSTLRPIRMLGGHFVVALFVYPKPDLVIHERAWTAYLMGKHCLA